MYDSAIPPYLEDESYPPTSPDNKASLGGGFNELYVVNCASNDDRVTAIPKGVSAPLHPWRLALL